MMGKIPKFEAWAIYSDDRSRILEIGDSMAIFPSKDAAFALWPSLSHGECERIVPVNVVPVEE